MPLSVAAAMMPAIQVPWPLGSVVPAEPSSIEVPATSWPARSGVRGVDAGVEHGDDRAAGGETVPNTVGPADASRAPTGRAKRGSLGTRLGVADAVEPRRAATLGSARRSATTDEPSGTAMTYIPRAGIESTTSTPAAARTLEPVGDAGPASKATMYWATSGPAWRSGCGLGSARARSTVGVGGAGRPRARRVVGSGRAQSGRRRGAAVGSGASWGRVPRSAPGCGRGGIRGGRSDRAPASVRASRAGSVGAGVASGRRDRRPDRDRGEQRRHEQEQPATKTSARSTHALGRRGRGWAPGILASGPAGGPPRTTTGTRRAGHGQPRSSDQGPVPESGGAEDECVFSRPGHRVRDPFGESVVQFAGEPQSRSAPSGRPTVLP